MRTRIKLLQAIASSAAILVAFASPVQAVSLNAVPTTIRQNMSTAGVYHGHTVIANTNMNRLEAGGSFEISCMSPVTGTLRGSRSLPDSFLVGPLTLYVTVPAQLPALQNMPGFESVSRGQTIQCTYYWTAFAREALYTIGIPGISIQVGGGEAHLSNTVGFTMRKPGTSTGNDDACIP